MMSRQNRRHVNPPYLEAWHDPWASTDSGRILFDVREVPPFNMCLAPEHGDKRRNLIYLLPSACIRILGLARSRIYSTTATRPFS